MPDVLRHTIRLVAGGALLTGLLAVTHTTASDPTEGAVLRIAVRTTAGTQQDCRRLSQQELDALPVHMRRPQVCESHALPYRLEVRVAGELLLDRTYTASGLHGDRPLVVGDDVTVAAGTQRVELRFVPESGEGGVATDRAAAQAAAHGDEDRVVPATAAPRFLFDGPVEFSEGRIRVATLDDTGSHFEIR